MDGGGGAPGYSLRTLCRALEYARAGLPTYGLPRALYDGFGAWAVYAFSAFTQSFWGRIGGSRLCLT